MKLKVDLKALDQAVTQMGAKRVEINLEFASIGSEPIDIELEQGIHVELDDIQVDNGLLSYEGRQILLYIQDQKGFVTKSLEGTGGYKYHIADCETLKDMRDRGRFERYVATNDLSGKFHVVGVDYQTGEQIKGTAELKVCRNCLKHLNYQGYSYGSNRDIFNSFNLGEFFSTYSSFFPFMPKQFALHSRQSGYTADWKKISREFRRSKGYICYKCNVDLTEHAKLLHVHHINGDTQDNRSLNLCALCIDCHRKEDFHNRMFVSHENMILINRARRVQNRLASGNWDDIFQLSDPAVHGVLHTAKHRSSQVPEVGYELEIGGKVIAELELAWPRLKCGIAIDKEQLKAGEKAGWDVWSVGQFIEDKNSFPVWG